MNKLRLNEYIDEISMDPIHGSYPWILCSSHIWEPNARLRRQEIYIKMLTTSERSTCVCLYLRTYDALMWFHEESTHFVGMEWEILPFLFKWYHVFPRQPANHQIWGTWLLAIRTPSSLRDPFKVPGILKATRTNMLYTYIHLSIPITYIYIYYSILYYAYVCGILCTTVGSSWPKKQLRRRLDRCEEHGITPSGSWNLALRRNSMKIEDPWLNQVHIYIYI